MRSLLLGRFFETGISGGNYFAISSVYNPLIGNYPALAANESTVFNVIPTDMYIEKLFIKRDAPGAMGSGASATITLIRNDVDTEVSVTLFETETENTYTSSSFLLSKGDVVKFRHDSVGGVAVSKPIWTFTIRTTRTNYYPILTGALSVLPQSTYSYNYISGSSTDSGSLYSSLNQCNQICAINGRLKSFYVKLRDNLGVPVRFTIFKNLIATSLTIDIGAGQSSGEVVADVTVAAGDLLSFGFVRVSTSPGIIHLSCGTVFESDVDGEFPLFFGSILSNLGNTITNAFSLVSCGNKASSIAGISTFNLYLFENVRIRDFYLSLFTAPGAGRSWDLYVYKNSVATALTFNIADTNKTGSDIINEVSSVAGDDIVMIFVPTNTPTVGANSFLYGGLGAFLDPIPETPVVEDPVNASIGCVDVIGYLSGNLDHLEGKEVIILADGEVITGRTVIGGSLFPALEHSYASVSVGLPYDSDLITLGTEE